MADAPGTCHLIGCPTKGTVDEHTRKPIGCPDTFAPYDDTRCLGFPSVFSRSDLASARLFAACSLDGDWRYDLGSSTCDPTVMALLVDDHKANCPNRSPR